MIEADKQREIAEALEQYIPGEEREIRKSLYGQNNTTVFVLTARGAYWLRLYENLVDQKMVQYEHEILQQLQSKELPFATPKLIPTQDGQTYAFTPSGKWAALFAHIEGTRPEDEDLTQMEAYGCAVGHLQRALAEVKPSVPPFYPGHFNIYALHPLVTPEAVAAIGFDSLFADMREEAAFFQATVERVGQAVSVLAEQLPKQIIHGDLACSNVLAVGENITGVLDFEFAATDLRAMEVATNIPQFRIYNGETAWERSWGKIEAFLKGFSSAQTFTAEEVDALPLLVELRLLITLLHHYGRYLSGHSGNMVQDKMREFQQDILWLQQHEPKFRDLYANYLLAN